MQSVTVNSAGLFVAVGYNNSSYPLYADWLLWTDLSGSRNHGTLVNSPTYSSTNGGSIVFDGVNNAVSLPTITPTSGATFSAWIYTNGTNSNNGTIFSNWGTGGNAYFIASSAGGRTQILVYFAGTLIFTITLPLNTWLLLTITHNGSTVRGYINGVLRNTSAGSLISATNVTSIGYDISRSNYPFKGNISAAQIYDRALTADEISTNFNALRGRYGL